MASSTAQLLAGMSGLKLENPFAGLSKLGGQFQEAVAAEDLRQKSSKGKVTDADMLSAASQVGVTEFINTNLAMQKQKQDTIDTHNALTTEKNKTFYNTSREYQKLAIDNMQKLAEAGSMEEYNTLVDAQKSIENQFGSFVKDYDHTPFTAAMAKSAQPMPVEKLKSVSIPSAGGGTETVTLPESIADTKGIILMADGTIGQRALKDDKLSFDDNKVAPTGIKPVVFESKDSEGSTDFERAYQQQLRSDPTITRADFREKHWLAKNDPKLTADERTAINLTNTPDFKAKYGNLSFSEQKDKALKLVKSRNPEYIKLRRNTAYHSFAVANEGKSLQEISASFDNMSKSDKIDLRVGQRNSELGKEHLKKNAGKAVAVDNMKADVDRALSILDKEDFNKDVFSTTADRILNTLPESVSEYIGREDQVLNTLKTQGVLGNLFFTYLNEVNKGAPSDRDLAIMREIVTGGDMANKEAAKTAVKTFMNKVMGDTVDYYSGNASEIYTVYTKAEKDSLQRLTPYENDMEYSYQKELNKEDNGGRKSLDELLKGY
jgi:hypothetical protein